MSVLKLKDRDRRDRAGPEIGRTVPVLTVPILTVPVQSVTVPVLSVTVTVLRSAGPCRSRS